MKKFIIIAALLAAPWLLLAGCKRATVEAPRIEKTQTLPPVIVDEPVPLPVAKPVKHRVKHRRVVHFAPAAPVEPTCQPLDAICFLIEKLKQ